MAIIKNKLIGYQTTNMVIKMKATTKFKLGTLGAFLGYTAATCGIGYGVGHKTGYHAAEEAAAKEIVCLEKLAPVKNEFGRECSDKTADTFYNGSLNFTLRKRDIIEERYGCPEETWMCEPTLPSDLQRSEFRAVYRR